MAVPTLARTDPRRPHHRRRLLVERIRGDAGDRDRLAHDPRLFDLRRHRRFDKVDENTTLAVGHQRRHLQRHGQPVAEPDADALAEHVDRRGHPDHVVARRSARWCSARRRSRSSASRCSSVSSPAPTRRSSSPRRCWPSSRSASRATATFAGGSRPGGAAARRRARPEAAVDAGRRRATGDGGRRHRPARPRGRRAPVRRRRRTLRPRTSRRGPARRARQTMIGDVDWPARPITSETSPTSRKPGVVFKDITPLLGDADAFAPPIDAIADHFDGPARRPGARHRGPRLHPRRAGRLPVRRRVRARAQGRQAAVGDRAGRSTSSSTAPTCSRSTATRSTPASRC